VTLQKPYGTKNLKQSPFDVKTNPTLEAYQPSARYHWLAAQYEFLGYHRLTI